MNKREFAPITLKLFNAFYIDVNEALITIWYEEFKNYDLEDYERSINEYIRTANKKPYLSDIYKIINKYNNFSD